MHGVEASGLRVEEGSLGLWVYRICPCHAGVIPSQGAGQEFWAGVERILDGIPF